MQLPVFKPTKKQRQWVRHERATASFIRAFWRAASRIQRTDKEFLWFLTTAAWTNERRDGAGWESTREWRNGILAEYLGVDYATDSELGDTVSAEFPKLTATKARTLISSYTGITHYYTAIRPRTRQYLLRHASTLADLFATVGSTRHEVEDKIKRVATTLAHLPHITTPRGGSTPPFNPFSPVLACLDPARRFPIMNQRTHRLLQAIGKDHDGDGALALYRLIGTHGIRDSFELDVYSQIAEKRFKPAWRRRLPITAGSQRVVPIKSEIDSIASLG